MSAIAVVLAIGVVCAIIAVIGACIVEGRKHYGKPTPGYRPIDFGPPDHIL